MFGSIRRKAAAVLLTIGLAACQVVPDGGRPGPTTPEPTKPVEPSDTALPTDTARHRIALLVPLSGENAEVGRSIANATTMALLDTNAENLRITTYDTAAGVGSATSSAIADGNKLILGPLMASEVTSVLAQARPANVPLITFSNDTSVAQPDVFVMGHVPEQSIERSIEYVAMQGVRRFAALVPNGDYGDRTANALEGAVMSIQGTLIAVERYDRNNTSVVSAANRLKARGGYDAVLIADGANHTIRAAGALKKPADTVPVILGTELLNGDATVAASPAMRGALFSAVSDNRYRQFVTSYRTRFGEQPHRIATLGYDSVLLTLRIAREWQTGTTLPVRRMLAPEGFLGIDGPFRFLRSGIAERAMEVRRVGNGAISVVDGAPTQFD
ncbi:ABC transporter substrate-binding protein [Altererythrobacter xixiisoli]|uniref:ABC transporter substrate-binding protein n=1 Tax=Croceibacterium xixiisoli TaxID=1476466 RepID=A0A6I4TVK7_9SPHN|nr:penicillin-binding protein activator [Croceibacterium xixiisoli]MXO99994.1 ABC transporter substrate-binding protein [Croceibacterium xixiisoli]